MSSRFGGKLHILGGSSGLCAAELFCSLGVHAQSTMNFTPLWVPKLFLRRELHISVGLPDVSWAFTVFGRRLT